LNERSQIIDIMRAIAIVLVVLGHALIFARQASWLMQAIYSFHMPLLFSISGYVTAHSFGKTGQTVRARFWQNRSDRACQNFFLHKLVRSAKRLLIPYALGALVLIPIINAGIVNDIPRAFADAWHKALFTNRSLWFLPCCFFLVAVYSVSRMLRGWMSLKGFRDVVGEGVAFAGALLPVALVYILFPWVDYARSVLSYAFSFFVGAWMCQWIPLDRLDHLRVPVRLQLVSASLFLALAAFFVLRPFVAMKPLVGLASLVPVYCVARLISRRMVLAKVLSFVGQGTLLIYCLDFFATPWTIWRLYCLKESGVLSPVSLLSLTFLYVPVAIGVFCFLRLLYRENIRR